LWITCGSWGVEYRNYVIFQNLIEQWKIIYQILAMNIGSFFGRFSGLKKPLTQNEINLFKKNSFLCNFLKFEDFWTDYFFWNWEFSKII
jgi:hypothetical protein